VFLKILVFLDVPLFILINSNRRFEGSKCLHVHSPAVQEFAWLLLTKRKSARNCGLYVQLRQLGITCDAIKDNVFDP